MDRLLRSSASTVQLTLYDTSGDPQNPGAGAIAAAVTDSAGDPITGSPFAITNPPAATGVLKLDLPASLEALDVYDVVWDLQAADGERASQFELVGGFLFTIAELQEFDSDLADETKFPPARVVKVRQAVEERFEEICKVSFTLRGARAILDGQGRRFIYLPNRRVHQVVAASIDGTSLTAPELAELDVYPSGRLGAVGVWGSGVRNVEVFYEHGFTTPPASVKEAGMRYARHLLARGPLEDSERATGVQTELGFMRMSVAGRDGPTGLPEVDAVLANFGRQGAGVFA